VIGIVPVTDDDELLMMTSRGKIQRVAANEINIIGRNTQGVRIMNVDEGDSLTAIVKVPKEDEIDDEAIVAALPASMLPTTEPQTPGQSLDASADEDVSPEDDLTDDPLSD
jgi:DNA gyrase subunit A